MSAQQLVCSLAPSWPAISMRSRWLRSFSLTVSYHPCLRVQLFSRNEYRQKKYKRSKNCTTIQKQLATNPLNSRSQAHQFMSCTCFSRSTHLSLVFWIYMPAYDRQHTSVNIAPTMHIISHPAPASHRSILLFQPPILDIHASEWPPTRAVQHSTCHTERLNSKHTETHRTSLTRLTSKQDRIAQRGVESFANTKHLVSRGLRAAPGLCRARRRYRASSRRIVCPRVGWMDLGSPSFRLQGVWGI